MSTLAMYTGPCAGFEWLAHFVQDSGECRPKLHGFFGGVRDCRVIHAEPRVVDDQTWSALALLLYTQWRQSQVRQVFDLFVR